MINEQNIRIRTELARKALLAECREFPALYRILVDAYDFHEPGSMTGTQFTIDFTGASTKEKESEFVLERSAGTEESNEFGMLYRHRFLTAWCFNPASVGIDDAVLKIRPEYSGDAKGLTNLIGCPFLFAFPKPRRFLGAEAAEAVLISVCHTEHDNVFLNVCPVVRGMKAAITTYCLTREEVASEEQLPDEDARFAAKLAVLMSSDEPQIVAWRRSHIRRAVQMKERSECFSVPPDLRPVDYLFVTSESIGTGETGFPGIDHAVVHRMRFEPKERLVRMSDADWAGAVRAIEWLREAFLVKSYLYNSQSRMRMNCTDLLRVLERERERHPAEITFHTLCRVLIAYERISLVASEKAVSLTVPQDIRGNNQRIRQIVRDVNGDYAQAIIGTRNLLTTDFFNYTYIRTWHIRNNWNAIHLMRRNLVFQGQLDEFLVSDVFYALSKPVLNLLSEQRSTEAAALYSRFFELIGLAGACADTTGSMDVRLAWSIYRVLREIRSLNLPQAERLVDTLLQAFGAAITECPSRSEEHNFHIGWFGWVLREIKKESAWQSTKFTIQAEFAVTKMLLKVEDRKRYYGHFFHSWRDWL